MFRPRTLQLRRLQTKQTQARKPTLSRKKMGPPSSSRDPKVAQASLLEEPPSSGPGFIRVRSGPPLGRRPASSDPVALHQEYRRHWAKANIPGERRHDRLRWAVRGWMMGEEPL